MGSELAETIVQALTEAPMLVSLSDATGTILDAHGAWIEILGWKPSEVVGRNVLSLCDEQDRAAVAAALAEVGRGTRVSHFDMRMLHRDGSSRVIAWSGPGLAVNDRLVGFGIDVTAERSTRMAAMRTQERLAAILDTVPDYILWADRDAVVTYTNRTYPGITPAQVVGTRLYNWSAPADRDRYEAAYGRVMGGGPPESMVLVGAGESGPSWYELRIGPIVDDDEVVGGVVVGRDISREKRAEEHERQKSRLETAGLLTAQVAHDVNNLLSLVLLGLEDVQSSIAAGETDQASAAVAELLEAMTNSHDVTRQLLGPRRSPTDAGPRDLAAMVRNSRPLLTQALGPGVSLRLDVPDEPLEVNLDPVELQRILVNLATNARRAIDGGGHVLCRVRPGTTSDPILRDGSRPIAVLHFEDDGRGMTWDVQSRAFEPFFTSGSHRGTGLGLASIYRIVHASGGDTALESRVGEGTKVLLYLSRSLPKPAVAAAPTLARSMSETAVPNATVLVVDDETSIRSLVSRYMSRLGYRVLEGNGVADAVRVSQAHPGRVDLVICDVHLMDGDGFGLIDQLRERDPAIDVVFISGFLAADDRVRANDALILEKPFTRTELADIVRALLDARTARAD